MTPRPVPPTSAPRRRALAHGAGAAAAACLVLLGGAAAGHAAPVQTGPSGAVAVECLDQRLRPADACPAVDADVKLELDGDDLLVSVANAGAETWEGGPLAVELPVPDADVDAPEGRDDPTGQPGTPEWTTRVGTVVSRCVFEPVTQLRSGADLTCRLHRLGLPDGEHELWITGFVGGLPEVRGTLGDEAPAVGVVPAAATRSVRFRLDGDRAVALDASAAAGPREPAHEPAVATSVRTARLPYVLGATAVLGVGIGLYLRHRRMS